MIPKLISDADNEALIRPFSVVEGEHVIKDMPCDKLPDPDGLSGACTANSVGILLKKIL